MLKKAIILSLGLGLGMALVPMASSANSGQPALQASGVLVDDITTDSSNSNDYDNSTSADDDSITSSDDSSDNDDAASVDTTE